MSAKGNEGGGRGAEEGSLDGRGESVEKKLKGGEKDRVRGRSKATSGERFAIFQCCFTLFSYKNDRYTGMVGTHYSKAIHHLKCQSAKYQKVANVLLYLGATKFLPFCFFPPTSCGGKFLRGGSGEGAFPEKRGLKGRRSPVETV